MADHIDADSAAGPCASRASRFLPLGAALGAAAVFLRALANGFIDWDDGSLLVRNPWYRGLGLSNLAWMFTTVRMGHWMLVNWLSFGLDHALWGMNPASRGAGGITSQEIPPRRCLSDWCRPRIADEHRHSLLDQVGEDSEQLRVAHAPRLGYSQAHCSPVRDDGDSSVHDLPRPIPRPAPVNRSASHRAS